MPTLRESCFSMALVYSMNHAICEVKHLTFCLLRTSNDAVAVIADEARTEAPLGLTASIPLDSSLSGAPGMRHG
jgi:hypothetical protein